MTVRLRVADNVVHVLVSMVEPGDYIGIGERSAGLRQFVALRAHIASENAGPEPILLVDEADIHLHYDAQADLIQVLNAQEEAAKVIYTTHSAGCLPPDLGTGIRIVLPTKEKDARGDLQDTDDSKIVNWFWTEEVEGTGFSPILIGMGASTFAFAAARRAVIGEGASDAILLPTLFREVTALDHLDFQVAPGLSNVSENAARELDLVAARVVHLLDGDQGGNEIENLLLRAGVPKRRILRLGGRKETLVLEDMVDADVYLAAVNSEIARWHDDSPTMPKTKLSTARRPRSVTRWCESQVPPMAPPGRRAVAHRILEQRERATLVAAPHKARLKRLYDEIQTLLGRPSHEA
jgi:predicted ATP-dependent endonuclease of OLD family